MIEWAKQCCAHKHVLFADQTKVSQTDADDVFYFSILKLAFSKLWAQVLMVA